MPGVDVLLANVCMPGLVWRLARALEVSIWGSEKPVAADRQVHVTIDAVRETTPERRNTSSRAAA